MLRKIVLALPQRVTPLRTHLSPMMFGSEIQKANKLKREVEGELKHEEENVEDLTQYTNFFENQGWGVNYNSIQVELSKKNGPYNLKVLFNAKTPMSMNENEEQGEESEEGSGDFSEISVFINKNGSDKWLCAEFLLSNQQSQLSIAYFINNYEEEKAERLKGRVTGSIGYTGPELSSLEERFQEAMYEFIEGVGVNEEILQRVSEFGMAYEHQFYVEWLKDFNSLL